MENFNESEYLIAFGERLRQERIRQKDSQEKMAARIGITKEHYGKIERGLSKASIITIFKIGSALDNLSFDYLLANSHYNEHECINILKNILESSSQDEINKIKEYLLLTEHLTKQSKSR